MRNSKFAKIKLDSFEHLSKEVQKKIVGGYGPTGGGGGGGTPPPLNCSSTSTPTGTAPWQLGQSGVNYWTESYCCYVVYGGNDSACRSVCSC